MSLCAGICAELRGRAAALEASMRPCDWATAGVERARADHWLDLSHRIAEATAGDSPAFAARDVELVRWYRLVQLRRVRARTSERDQRARQLDRLFEALYAALPLVVRPSIEWARPAMLERAR